MPRAFLVKKIGRGASGLRTSPVQLDHCHNRQKELDRWRATDKNSNEIGEKSRVSEIRENPDVTAEVTEGGTLTPTDRCRFDSTRTSKPEVVFSDSLSSLKRTDDQNLWRFDPLGSEAMMIKRFLIEPKGGHPILDPPRFYAPYPLSVIQPSHGPPTTPGAIDSPSFLLESLSRFRSKTSLERLEPETLTHHPVAKGESGPMGSCCPSPRKSPDVPFPSISGLPFGVSGPFVSEATSVEASFGDVTKIQRFHFAKLSTKYDPGYHHHSHHHRVSSLSPSSDSLLSHHPVPQPEVTYRSRLEAPRFKCEACQKSYSTFNGLSKHKEFHCTTYVKKMYACPHCDSKAYTSLGALKMHIRTHTLPCRCKLCGKAFSRPWLLQGHLRTHTGEKPFECPHCCRAFADRSNLRAHLQTHADIKKYHCRGCSKSFSRMSLLLKHKENSCFGMAVR